MVVVCSSTDRSELLNAIPDAMRIGVITEGSGIVTIA
jgi:hypothetical protein